MMDIVEKLRSGVSGPFKSGRKWVVAYSLDPKSLLEAADEIERLRAQVAALMSECEKTQAKR